MGKNNEIKPFFGGLLKPTFKTTAERFGITGRDIPEFNSQLTWIKVEDIWSETSLNDDWIVAYRLIVQPNFPLPVVGEVRIFPNETNRETKGQWSAEYLGGKAQVPKGGLTARAIRSVKIGAHQDQFEKMLDHVYKVYGDSIFDSKKGILGRAGLIHPSKQQRKERRGRPGKPDLYFARLAQRYDEAIRKGSRTPISDIARQLRANIHKIRAEIHEARKKDLLTQGNQGRWGGLLTRRAQAILKDKER